MDNLLVALIALSPAIGEVAKKLFDVACYGIKRFVEPYYLARDEKFKAKAELEIFRTNPLKQLEFAQELLNNTDGRTPEETAKELANICKIIGAAVGCTKNVNVAIGENPYSEAEDKEWYARFFDEARYISDEQLQEVWGRLLAERLIRPAGVNNRVLYFIRDLDKNEIETIRRALRVFINDSFTPNHIIEGFEGMEHDMVTLLALRIAHESGDVLHPMVTTVNVQEEPLLYGHGYNFKIVPLDVDKEVNVSCYALTPEGRVLSRLCVTELTCEEAQRIRDHLNARWAKKARVEVVEK